MEKILVAMSGGVDSSVAALLLKQQGFEVAGAYMKNWINEDNVAGHCPWMQDIDDARAVAGRIGIEFRVVNLMRDYRRLVVDYLLDGYQRGLTPNPDIMCNREVKFGVFRAYAKAEGFAAVATGHYARRAEEALWAGCPHPADGGRRRPPHNFDLRAESGRAGPLSNENSGAPSGRGFTPRHDEQTIIESRHKAAPTFALLEGADKNKDQSYFLALLSQEQVRDACFPIGHLKKPELRRLAREAGLPTADKKDSQGICFIGEVKMADFLRAYVPERPGPVVRTTDGAEIGRHRGLHYYTIGQRKGIGIPSNADYKNYVVVGKRASDHALLVAFDSPDAPGLWTHEARVHSLSFIGGPLAATGRVECRVRYRDPRVFCEFTPIGRVAPNAPTSAHIKFEQPQRALAPGQILALYDGERLLGGGVFA